MKFSLKTYLVTLCVVGATLGVMGKLFVESPETFFRVLTIGATVVPFLLACGTIVWIGLRGGRNWKLVTWGGMLFLTPITAYLALALLWPSGNPLQVMGSRRLIQVRLPNTVDEPWVWNELTRRLNDGSLSQEEVDDAVVELTSYIKRTNPRGWNKPFAWQHEFLAAATKGKLISDDVLVDLSMAFFGPQPVVKPPPTIAKNGPGFLLAIDYGNPWSPNSGLGVALLWDVKQVRVDGAPMAVKDANLFGQNWNGFVPGKFAPGTHEILVDIECALVNESDLGSFQPAEIPMSRWPKARKRWTATATMPLKVQ